MSKEKVARIVDGLEKLAFESTFSGDPAIYRLALRYRQGNRIFYTTALAAEEIVVITHIDSIDKKVDSDPDKRWNRPLDPDHVAAIKNYLTNAETKDDYILPSITLDAEKALNFMDFFEGEDRRISIGYLTIPITYRFHVTDGQHRIKAIKEALNDNQDLKQHAVAVNIVQEGNLEKVHQDFADCAKVKPIAASLITSFETRDAIRVFTKEVCELVPLFEKRVERISSSVGKTSSKLYTINHIKIACEELLIGNSTGQDRTKSIKCAAELEDHKFDVQLERVVKFFNLFAQTNPQWKYVLGLDSNNGQATATLKKLKGDYLLFNATALLIIGRVGHEILKNPQLLEHKTKELAGLPWSRTVNGKPNPFWEGTILLGDTVVNTREAIAKASAKVKHHLKLPLGEHEKKLILEMQPTEPELVEAS